jgi:DNA invertase Pin-like site-specific DNA recombinase
MAHELTDDALRRLVAEGVSQREIARRTGLSRATLYKRFKRLGLGPVQTPVQATDTGAVSSVDTGAVQPLDTGAVQRLDRLEDDVQGLRQLVHAVLDRLDRPPVSTPVQITTLPPMAQRRGGAVESVAAEVGPR